ncbi:DMP19 family protein [Nocardia lijiangensis]|uniref:DMP19 family protein n=1 Tax=Nocardia lijiangensis TaxID=299618 RepID=UPI003D73C822
MSVYNERLQQLGQRAAQLIDNAEDLDETTRDLVYLTVLAADFDYQVKNGGFGQLIYNWGRERLEQCDGMLRAVGAPVAVSFYVRAVSRCAEDLVDFDQFMDDFATPTDLGQDLTLLSVEYLRGDTSFDDEIAEFLDVVDARL